MQLFNVIINKYINQKKKRYFGNFDINVWYCGIIWPGGMRFFILLAKTTFGKKDSSRRCGTVPLQQPTGGFSSGWGGGEEGGEEGGGAKANA